jgi:hypothetical protein
MMHEQQVKIFILKKDDDGNPFPDERMIALARENILSGVYLTSIAAYANQVIAEHAQSVECGNVLVDEEGEPIKPIRVQKVELVLELITGLDRAKAFIDPKSDLSEKIESDHAQGSITRETFHFTD